jgi:hypothetical protein
MALSLIVPVWFDISGDGSSTVANIDLTTDAVSFSAGINNTFQPTGGDVVARAVSKGFRITNKNLPTGTAYGTVITDGSIAATSSVSGTVMTITFASAPANTAVTRCVVELLFAA